MIERGESVDNLPNVSVFERAGSPGGVWRSQRNQTTEGSSAVDVAEEKKESDVLDPSHNTQMYEALWTNGPKEGIEFFDYTYDEHFGRQLPIYMPRAALLEYMLARVVKKCPSFFEKYVHFHTSVTKVVYNENEGKFHVTTHNTLTGKVSTALFDKCIWAAGDNAEPSMPHTLLESLDGFQGRVIHSSDTATFGDDVRGKRILLVGGSYSAEDLALMACKVGVEKVYVASRCDDNAITWMGNWPGQKVDLVLGYTPSAVENGSTIVLKKTRWIIDESYEIEEDEEPRLLEDIDTIILCTGYRRQFDMLEPKIRDCVDKAVYHDMTFPVPDDWKMAENGLTENLGDVPVPKEARWYGSYVPNPGVYRGVMIDNPNMMFLRHEHSDYPILAIDGVAWLFMQYVTGGRELPSRKEMKRQNIEQGLFEMKHYPLSRFYMDRAYGKKWKEWEAESDPEWESMEKAVDELSKYDFLVMARTMQEAKYPLSLGTYEALNKFGRRLVRYGWLTYNHRVDVADGATFRDANDAHKFKSLFTGTEAIPLKMLWMDIDENEDKHIV